MNNSRPGIARSLYCFLIFIISCAVLFAFPKNAEADDSSTVTVTLHAGDNGYFDGDTQVKTKESVQTIGEAFSPAAEPAAIDGKLTFMGWSALPETTVIDIQPGSTVVDEKFPTELYAIWAENVEVTYQSTNGYFVIDGIPSGQLIRLYPVGDRFDDTVTPESFTDQLSFSGWFSNTKGKGEQYTNDTVLDRLSYQAFAYWKPDMNNIEELALDKEYDFDLDTGSRLYSFTPDETAVYELVTWDAVTQGPQAYLTLLDLNMNRIAAGISIDDQGNASLSHELTAGTTYLFELSEFTGQPITFGFKIHKPETGIVTFHANLPDGQAYFDNDPAKDSKQIEIMQGNDIHGFKGSGLEVAPSAKYSFLGWSKDPDAEYPDEELIVDGDIDAYAVYDALKTIILDANGGTFTGGEVRTELNFSYGDVFYVNSAEPTIADESKRFSGWASTSDAEEPDIFEYIDMSDDLPPVIYAVYGDAITVTFDADGGYFYYNPSNTIQQFIRGKGHIFYGLTVNHEDPNYSSLGWKDQYGNEIPYVQASVNPYYQMFEDTTFTPIWTRYVIIDANGGYFPWDREKTDLGIWLRTETPFSNQSILDMGIFPLTDDSLYYPAGWATDPDAEEPDIIDGETDVKTLPHRIYTVWKEDSYYLNKGDGSTWEKGSDENLEFIVKRSGDDTETFRTFSGIEIDGTAVASEETFKAGDKNEESLYLSLLPAYLETLDAGSHTLTMIFNNNMSKEVVVSAEFIVQEKAAPTVTPTTTPTITPTKTPTKIPTKTPSNYSGKSTISSPKTGDGSSAGLWLILAAGAAAGIVIAARRIRRAGKN